MIYYNLNKKVPVKNIPWDHSPSTSFFPYHFVYKKKHAMTVL